MYIPSEPSWASSFFLSHFERAIKAQDSFIESATSCQVAGKSSYRSRKVKNGLYTAVYADMQAPKRKNRGLRRNTGVWKQEIHEKGLRYMPIYTDIHQLYTKKRELC
uniref:Uncharacterized protein n=1 Tax=Solanum tuberosum TaxID=4113 RepID=M1C7P8_SOLTU